MALQPIGEERSAQTVLRVPSVVLDACLGRNLLCERTRKKTAIKASFMVIQTQTAKRVF
jgi:hypothetical protein